MFNMLRKSKSTKPPTNTRLSISDKAKTRIKNGIAIAGFVVLGIVVTQSPVLQPAAGGQSPVLGTGGLATAITDKVTFYDSFDNQQLLGWEGSDDMSWGAEQGALQAWQNSDSATATTQMETYIIAGNTEWDNYEYSVRVKTSEHNAAGVLFRYKDAGNYYRFTIDGQKGFVQIGKMVDGVYAVLQSKIHSFPLGRYVDLQVVAVGNAIVVSVDAMVVFDIIDTSLPAGRIGLYSQGSEPVFFDDVVVGASLLDSFTIAVLPDTQAYTQQNSNIFTAQTAWIAENRGAKNIAFVMHEGDIVNDICQDSQWQNASASLGVLDGKVPYAFTAGNHDVMSYSIGGLLPDDYPYSGCAARADFLPNTIITKKIDEYFPVSRYRGSPTFGGVITEKLVNVPPGGTTGMTNSYHLFSAGGIDFVVISLRYGPSDALLASARLIANQYPERKVILLTHDYLSQNNRHRGTMADGSRCTANPSKESTANILCTPTNMQADGQYEGEDWSLPSVEGMNSGIEIWDELVKDQSNIAFVLNGHVTVGAEADSNSGRLISERRDGSTVHQLLANYQSFGPTGGEGYLRLMTFYPSLKRVDVSTYSPYLDAELTDATNRFTLLDVDL
jgi:hypothetical protein